MLNKNWKLNLFSSNELKHVLSKQNLLRKTKLLVILSIADKKSKTVSDIKAIAEAHGLREIKKWNVSQILSSASDSAIRVPDGWEITETGIQLLYEEGLVSASPVRQYQSELRKYAVAVSSENTRVFLEECISALEANLLRSAVILSWAGAISILHTEVIENHLSDFNIELQKRNPKQKPIKSADDLITVKEYDFLQIITSLSIIGKNVKQELEPCLQLRNACAHPNSLSIGESRVSSHLEILILNIYQKFVS